MAAKADKKGMKRICTGCGTHFYDFEKRPIVCPSCDMEFTGEAKAKARRTKSPANDVETSKVKPGAVAKKPEAEDEDIVESGDSDVISLDDVDEPDDMDEDDESVKIDLDDDIEDLDDADLDDDDDDLDEEIDVDIDKD